MTCIGADIFYGIKIPSNLTDQQLAALLILLYKKLNGLEYKEIDVDAMLAESKGDEEELHQPTTTTSSRTSAKRKLATKSKPAKKQRIEPIDYNLLHLANQTLGFSVGTSMGNTWNGEGFSAIVIIGSAYSADDSCLTIDPHNLINLAAAVPQTTLDNVAQFLELIKQEPQEPSWLLYASAG